MNSIEKSAKTYEEAVQAALADLNASISEVNVETLEEGSKGLFGLFGSRPYKIRVTLKEQQKDDDLDLDALLHGDKKKAEPKPQKQDKPTAPKPQKQEKPAEPKPQKVTEPKPAKQEQPAAPKHEKAEVPAEPVAQEADARVDEQAAAEVPAEKRKRPPRKRKPKQPAADRENAEQDKPAEKKPLPPKAPAQPIEKPVITMLQPEEITADSAAGKARAFLAELTQLMGVNVEIAVGTDPEGNIFVQMTGDTLGVLIGRRGETLDALQYLTSLKVNRGQEGYTRVTLDTENYRAKREDTLIRLANRMANRAVKTGRKVSLEPMNPYERRIIHSALQANEAVDTHSEDEEPNRHVVITLRK